MTRLASTGWATVLAGLAISGAAYAQATPTSDDTLGDDQTNPQPNPPSPEPAPQPDASGTVNTTGTVDTDGTVDTTIHGDINATANGTSTDATVPASTEVDVNQPDTVTTGTTNYVVTPTPTVVVHEEEGPMSGIGIAIAAGGGAGGFVNDTVRGATDVGGDWDVRATIGTRSPIAFEGSYIGSAQGINALGLDSDALLVGNGVQGAVRLNATLDLPVQPFAFGGIAWRHYKLTNTDQNLSDVRESDDVLEVPLGIGIAGKSRGLILDLRGEYRIAENADLIPRFDSLTGAQNDFGSMDRWGVKGTIGVEF
jgi:hypothetical protein